MLNEAVKWQNLKNKIKAKRYSDKRLYIYMDRLNHVLFCSLDLLVHRPYSIRTRLLLAHPKVVFGRGLVMRSVY